MQMECDVCYSFTGRTTAFPHRRLLSHLDWMKMIAYSFVMLFGFTLANQNGTSAEGVNKIYTPPPKEHLTDHRDCLREWWMKNDSTINCHGARFQKSNGYFQPCNRHSHCYSSREPTDWCILPRDHVWSNWGCHCDKKLGSCVIERYDARRRLLQWSYCTPKSEFYCATHIDVYLKRKNKL